MIVLFGLYVFATPYFSDRHFYNYLVYILFAIFAVVVLLYRFLYFPKKINVRIFAMPLFAVFAIIGTTLFSHEYRYLLTVFLLAASYVIIYFLLEQADNTDLILRVTVYSLSAFTLLFAFHYRESIFDFSNFGSGRLAADNYFGNVNSVAYYFAACCILSLYLSLFGHRKIRFLFLIPFVFCFFTGTLTASRAFLVGTVFASISIFVIRLWNKPRVLIVCLVLLAIVTVALFFLPAFAFMKKRLIDMFNTILGNGRSVDYSTSTRLLWQDYATYLGTHHLLFGNGLNGFAIYSGVGTYSHANITETLCNTGIIGLLIYYSVFFIAVYDVTNKKMKYAPLVITFLVFLVCREFLSVSYTSKFNAFVFALIMHCGSLGSYKQRRKHISVNDYYVLEI